MDDKEKQEFAAQAGMNRKSTGAPPGASRVRRASGDEPVLELDPRARYESSPRKRG